jgi:hypothetical protein
MNLKHLTDEALLSETKRAVKSEKLATSAVLYHIQEVDRRRLFSALKYPSLFEYVKEELGYDGQETYRRIAAMRLLAELPEIAPAVESGKLSLTHLNMAQTHFNKETKARGQGLSKEEKKDVLRKVVGVSTRKAEEALTEVATYDEPKMSTLKVDQELLTKLKTLKSMLAHAKPNLTDNDLLHKLVDQEIERLSGPGKSTSISAVVRKAVWTRDGGKCANCGSIHAIEYDHFPIPKAMGGSDTTENLRLLCRNCNQRAAINFFGAEKMEGYLRSHH